MEASQAVWTGLAHQVKQLVPGMHAHQAKALALSVVGVMLSGDVRLPRVAEELFTERASPARTASIERRLRRFLRNPRVPTGAVWDALLPTLLGGWRDGARGPVRLVLDATPLDDWGCVMYLGILAQSRLLPVAWEVLPAQTSWEEAQWTIVERLFKRVAPLLGNTSCTLLADRGLAGSPLVHLCEELGWHYVLRIESNHQFQPLRPASSPASSPAASPSVSEWQRVDTLAQQVGQQWFGPARVWKETRSVHAYLSAVWQPEHEQAWFLLSDRPAGPARVADYARRMRVEATFLDAKSRGFRLEDSHVRDLTRLDRLLLVLSLALWWLARLGAGCLHHGTRSRYDRHDRRDKGLFRLGRLAFRSLLRRLPPAALRRSLLFTSTPSGWKLALRF